MNLEQYLDDVVVRGHGDLGPYKSVPSRPIFVALQQILRVLSNGWRAAALRDRITSLLEDDDKGGPLLSNLITRGIEFELRSVAERHHLLHLATWLMTDWPERFVRVCAEAGVWHSWALKDGINLPMCYVEPVRDFLYRPDVKDSTPARQRAREPTLFSMEGLGQFPTPSKKRDVRNVSALYHEKKTRQFKLPV
jgi:hypothetical protein